MAIDGIQISLGEVAATAASIRTINTELNVCLTEIKAQMNTLADSWKSQGADTIRNNFNKMSASFEDYKLIINNYAAFLDDTVAAYEVTENSITQNADLFA